MSQIVEYPSNGTIVLLAGQVARDAALDVSGQTKDILARIDELLAEAGTDKTKLLGAQIWLADIGDFSAMNEVWEAWVPEGHAPVRACVESRLADPRLKVEIQVTALKEV
ncbi:RidA family protein [Chelativorans sp. Marseille-P2723]|uniref:RidA family protein n=1 Tax=Chelativorans sp. Marseille-P2723 TaxID=2709133 RepID=UPI001570C29A|nr:RidA family protein [Chelativorans sp. Marseille-P2723]